MHLPERVQLLVELGKYMESDHEDWQNAKEKAYLENKWFEPRFIELAVRNIVTEFLDEKKLLAWSDSYDIADEIAQPKSLGLVMAGNIPLVGFHDFLCAFVSGNRQIIKASSKDHILIEHLAEKMGLMATGSRSLISFAEQLKGCDAYIATGSNNSARYFEYYFGKYPHIIRKNRTSVAILYGDETQDELEKLADDVFLYFGMGCRNVTKLFVPRDYDFVGLLEAFGKYNWMADHHKYKNNYDYQLTLLILNKKYYMTNGSILLTENDALFSPISLLHFQHYADAMELASIKPNNGDIQTAVGKGFTPFGDSQKPGLSDYADGLDTMQFFHALNR